jgi:hypothetical protein
VSTTVWLFWIAAFAVPMVVRSPLRMSRRLRVLAVELDVLKASSFSLASISAACF